jgi:5'-3' exonuclease
MDDMSGKPWGEGRFRAEYPGLDPAQWALVKAIGGCASDGIPGCAPGIGEGRAIAYLQNKLKPTSGYFFNIQNNDDRICDNMKLVRLPHPDYPKALISKPEPLRFSKKEFMDVCCEYNLASFTAPETLARWRRVFRGEWET